MTSFRDFLDNSDAQHKTGTMMIIFAIVVLFMLALLFVGLIGVR
ncbi:hypothetical protein J2755_001455 [Methanohalophilus levihalophilus]|nr:hypothetical protein [Methanohalophilus levihalophilus]MBP2030521.1 hypothetical protein [Methanohalophilus levihalophilus]